MSLYIALTLVLVTIILSFLVFTTHLTTILNPIGWGVTLSAILIGLAVNRVFGSFLTDVFFEMIRLAESLAKVPYEEKLSESAHGGTLVAYLIFVFLSIGSYNGLYGWAHRIRWLGGYSHRILVSDSPTITLLLLLLDFISALALAGACGFYLAIDLRLLRVVLLADNGLQASFHRQLAPLDQLGRLSPPIHSTPDHDTINWTFVTRYCAVMAATGLLASIVAFAVGQSFAQLAHPISRILAVAGILAVVSFAMQAAAANATLLVIPLGGTSQLTAITTAILFGCGTALYVTIVGLLPQPAAHPPVVSLLQTVDDPFVFIPSIDVLTAPTFYFELGRAGSVLVVVATVVTVSVYAVRWWHHSTLTLVPAFVDRGLGLFTWPVRAFIGKMTAANSRWSWRVRGGVIIQMLGLTMVIQSVYAAHSVWVGVAFLVGGGAIQAIFIWIEGAAGTSTRIGSKLTWSLACCLLPLVGGFSFVFAEMQQS